MLCCYCMCALSQQQRSRSYYSQELAVKSAISLTSTSSQLLAAVKWRTMLLALNTHFAIQFHSNGKNMQNWSRLGNCKEPKEVNG